MLSPTWVALFLPQLGEVPGGLALLGAAIVLITAAVYALTGEKRTAQSRECTDVRHG